MNLDEIQKKINSKLDLLNYYYNRLSCSNKNVRFFYNDKIKEINYDLLDLRAQIIYCKNYNNNQTIDIHGANKYFVDYYLNDLLYYKLNFHQKVLLICGKGSFVLFNSIKKFLNIEKIKYKIEGNNFVIQII